MEALPRRPSRRRWLGWLAALAAGPALAQAQRVQTPYRAPKVLFDIYLDHPDKLAAALYWVRSFFQPLFEAPYSLFPEDVRAIVLMHGTEIVTLARHHEARYAEVVQRMRYWAGQGVEFRVCGLALQDYGYRPEDLQPFVRIAPSAITELVHWQNEGYALVVPQITDKRVSIEQIR
ncbi:DsrE/DsrF-like family protein [Tepidimonas sediminis]|uniref:DsrE/DsrF-like family protein n=1 Tax=Tepidimonas sediminis TaxID=2588941 RepID=A0A554WR92_9BURK|nr:DsrE family protein [Tepidimonas sediminis]TSE26096.1 DsrE/DsrF-like family protein [Tepidimonas sediminis]